MSDLAYIAGLVDGEGWIGIRIHNKSTTFTPGLAIRMTKVEGLQVCSEVLGGKIIERDVSKYNPKAQNAFIWELGGKTCIEALKQIQFLLRVKRPQADTILSHEWVRYNRSNNIPDEIRKERQVLYESLKTMNTIGKELRVV